MRSVNASARRGSDRCLGSDLCLTKLGALAESALGGGDAVKNDVIDEKALAMGALG
jgi:hypothetical protein